MLEKIIPDSGDLFKWSHEEMINFDNLCKWFHWEIIPDSGDLCKWSHREIIPDSGDLCKWPHVEIISDSSDLWQWFHGEIIPDSDDSCKWSHWGICLSRSFHALPIKILCFGILYVYFLMLSILCVLYLFVPR